MKEALVRQMDLIPMESLSKRIHIIGAGATGATASLFLAKMGFINQWVMDFDDVDIVNMNCQMFGRHHIGMPKVDALSSMVEEFTGAKIQTTNGKFEKGMMLEGIVLCALDSMEGRQIIFDAFMRSPTATHIIDPRIAIQYGCMYVVDKNDKESIESYKKTLHSDADAVQAPCTTKNTMFTSAIVSGIMCKATKDIAVDGKTFKSMQYNIEKNDCMFF